MAIRFMRVDLSDEARDFRSIAIEPGVPMLDRSNSNAKILFRWLGGMVAEPVWEGASVNFFARDDHGGRLEEVILEPVTPEDLESTLQEDIEMLRSRIEKAKPETSTERAVCKILRHSFVDLVDNPNRTDLDNYFFRYRDVQGRWRLVWAWGYQRVDQEPAPSVVCTDPTCRLLFVRRAGQSPKCPHCEKALTTRPVVPIWRKPKVLAGALLLLLLFMLALWLLWPTTLIVTPGEYAGPVGSRIEFNIHKAGLFWKEDVTRQAVGVVLDPSVAKYDQNTASARLINPGTTVVRFHLSESGDGLVATVALLAGSPENPERLVIEPRIIELGIGTTARPKVIGEYGDGRKVDLTDAAEWEPLSKGPVYCVGGFLEGKAVGSGIVTARYRARPEVDYVDATANVNVSEINFELLELAIDPLPVGVGRASKLRIDAVSDQGERFSILESSLLEAEVMPGYLASVQGANLKGEQVGDGKLSVTFAGKKKLTGEIEFTVELGPGIDRLVVTPEEPKMVVGQIAELNIVSPSDTPIQITSADSNVVQITEDNRLIGRGEGTSQVEVTQGSETSTVEVTVATADFDSIRIDPPRIVVLVDDALGPRVLGRIKSAEDDGKTRDVEIAPYLLACTKRPSTRYAQFNAKSMELRGVAPTDPGKQQSLGFRFESLRASALVDVVVAPLRLALTPAGPVDLPLGQRQRLRGVAIYSGGRRVEVLPERLQWDGQSPEGATAGLELRDDQVVALRPDAGPLHVSATYFGNRSNEVEFNAAEPGLVNLRLEADRTLCLVGETGRITLSGTGPSGDLELVPELAEFNSPAPDVLNIDKKTGAFRAVAPGKVTITGKHVAAKEPASLELTVYDPANVDLVFKPNDVILGVNERAELQLWLVARKDGKVVDEVKLSGPGVGYAIAQPQAVRWYPPTLIGVSPTDEAFELNASYFPYLPGTATARIQVVSAVDPANIRIVPSQVSRAPGQRVAFRLEQQLPDKPDEWKEIRPDAVAWTVPPGLIWVPPTEDLLPTATVPEGATGEFELRADFGNTQAVALITAKDRAPDPNDPGAKLVLHREPAGRYLPVGKQQRYTIMVDKDGTQEPAADVVWPKNFENEFVQWQAPVLTAKGRGYRQQLRAEVGGRGVIFDTTTYQPSRIPSSPLPRPTERPELVRILSDQGQSVRFPVGAKFDDFRVVVEYPDGFTRLVTKKATLSTPEPLDRALLSATDGLLVGLRPGQTAVSAEFDGVKSEQPLAVAVTAEVDVDEIRVTPAPVTILPRESVPLEVHGFKEGKSVGIITGLGNIKWLSSDPQVASVDGPVVTGRNLGGGFVTASLGSVRGRTAVNVVAEIADSLVIDPGLIRIRVGEVAQIGTDVLAYRGQMEMSQLCRVTPDRPDIVQYVPETRSLVGQSPGTSGVALTLGDKLGNLTVEVVHQPLSLADARVVVEPAGSNLSPGQALPMRVYVVAATGERIDRTDSAVLSSSDPGKLMIQGNRACAVVPPSPALPRRGRVRVGVTAKVVGVEQAGKASVVINDEQISELIVEPSRLDMLVGDVASLRILGRSASGTHELFGQSDLKITAGGTYPEAIRISGTSDIEAVYPGQADVAVNWQDRLKQQVPVGVIGGRPVNLQIEPAQIAINPGQGLTYRVTGMQGGQIRVLGPEQGVQLFVGDGDVAEVVEGMTVRGNMLGRTPVIAKLGDQKAEASLQVVAGTPPGTTQYVEPFGVVDDRAIIGGHTIVDDGGQVIVYGPDHWDDEVWVGRGGEAFVDNPQIIVPPAATAAGLRFVPDVLRLATDSPGAPIQVVEVLADGSTGRDVTNDPNLEIGDPVDVAVREGKNVFRPIKAGEERVGARLGALTADPLLISVGGMATTAARLEVTPDPLVIGPNETGTFNSVMIVPGSGQQPFPVDYKVTPAADQTIVTSPDGKQLVGRSDGATQVVVTAVDPEGRYGEVSTTATVQVVRQDDLSIEPPTVSVRVGQPTPQLAVMAAGEDGLPYQVPAELESMDPNVLAPDPARPGQFVAKALGGTQIRARYRGKEAHADVTVTGERFVQVDTKPETAGTDSFTVDITVLAAKSEGPLEYRVYGAGQTPQEAWTPARMQEDGEYQEVQLRSPQMKEGPRSTVYQLIIESRDRAGGSVQQFPYTFQLGIIIKETDKF